MIALKNLVWLQLDWKRYWIESVLSTIRGRGTPAFSELEGSVAQIALVKLINRFDADEKL